MHGGLSPQLTSLKKLKKLTLPIREITPLINDILWSDPVNDPLAFIDGTRGRGCQFGLLATLEFLSRTNLTHIIRGHECVYEGIAMKQDKHCITVFSSSSYSANFNKCGVLSLIGDEIKECIFPARKQITREEAFFFDATGQTAALERKMNVGHQPKILFVPTVSTARRRLSVTAVNKLSSNMKALNTTSIQVLKNPITVAAATARRFSVAKIQQKPLTLSSNF